jgi:hypothetical protein
MNNTSPRKNAFVDFWMPKIDTLEHARGAARYGWATYALLALGSFLPMLVLKHMGFMLYVLLFFGALFAYLAWRTYRRPTVVLNGISVLLPALTACGQFASLTAGTGHGWSSVVAPLAMAFASWCGLRGSIAVRKFESANPPPV